MGGDELGRSLKRPSCGYRSERRVGLLLLDNLDDIRSSGTHKPSSSILADWNAEVRDGS